MAQQGHRIATQARATGFIFRAHGGEQIPESCHLIAAYSPVCTIACEPPASQIKIQGKDRITEAL